MGPWGSDWAMCPCARTSPWPLAWPARSPLAGTPPPPKEKFQLCLDTVLFVGLQELHQEPPSPQGYKCGPRLVQFSEPRSICFCHDWWNGPVQAFPKTQDKVRVDWGAGQGIPVVQGEHRQQDQVWGGAVLHQPPHMPSHRLLHHRTLVFPASETLRLPLQGAHMLCWWLEAMPGGEQVPAWCSDKICPHWRWGPGSGIFIAPM